MAFRAGLPPIQLWFQRRGLPRRIFAWSVGAHAVVIGIAAWATWRPDYPQFRVPEADVTRQYAVQYLVLPPTTPRRTTDPEHRPMSRRGPVPSIVVPERFTPNASESPLAAGPAKPAQPVTLAMELPEGSVAGVGPGADEVEAPAGPGILARLGFRVPAAGGRTAGLDPRPGMAAGDSAGRGGTKVAELLTADGTACPELRRPPERKDPGLTVAVAFVVDARGIVDPRSLRVVESPERARIDHHFYSHIYAVTSTAHPDGKLRDLAASYDSVITDEVMSHVANLLFHPAMRDGQAISSTVLVSCQSPS